MRPAKVFGEPASESISSLSEDVTGSSSSIPLQAVREIIILPDFDRKAASIGQKEIEAVVASDKDLEQLMYYVTTIAQMSPGNPFQSFQHASHASHVVMAVTKFMIRINQAEELDLVDAINNQDRLYNEKKEVCISTS